MYSSLRAYIRHTIGTLLIATILFLGIGTLITSQSAIADSITRDVTNAQSEAPISDRAYQAMKAGRQQEQAMRSQQAEAKAEKISENETIGEKLNLNENLPESTQKFIDRFTDD